MMQQKDIQQSAFPTAPVLPEGRRPEGKTGAVSQNLNRDPLPDGLPDEQVKAISPAPRRKFSVSYKLAVLEAYEACDNALARGALLRKEGLYSSRISTWRDQRDKGFLGSALKIKTPKSVLEHQKLARENAHLKKKLAEAHAIIDLQKKVSELLGTHILSPQSNEID